MEMLWGLKHHVQDWLNSNKITGCSVVGLGKGHHGVEMWFHDLTYDEFINKYGKSFVTPYYKCYLTKSGLTDYKAYISMVKN